MDVKKLYGTDPEFMDIFEHFAGDEVIHQKGQELDDVTRYMAILATLLGCQGQDAFRFILPQALQVGLTPVMVKEVVYQSCDYLGFARMLPFLNIVNEELEKQNIALPLPSQKTTTRDNRLEKGANTQAIILVTI